MAITEAQRKAHDKYFRQAYSQVKLAMPNEEAAALRRYCADHGLTVAGFIRGLIRDAIAAGAVGAGADPAAGTRGGLAAAGAAESVSSANFKEKRANVETEHVDVELVEQKTGRKKKLKAPEQFFDAEYCDVREKRTHPLTESIELTEERKEADLNARINSELANQDKQQNARVASDNDFFLK